MSARPHDIFPCWAVVDLWSGGRIGALVSETQVAGRGFLALDLPGDDTHAIGPRLAPGAVWRLTPTTEAHARSVARLDPAPPGALGVWADDGHDDPEGAVFGVGEYRAQARLAPQRGGR